MKTDPKYSIQVNKAANSIKEIISGMRNGNIHSVNKNKDNLLVNVNPKLQEKSILVLPFENISSDPDQEYFSDGLTEEIITDLSHIHDLLVISRSSAMTFKGTKKTIPEIAEIVNVRYVLEGSVRKAGNNLRIVAQLIDTKSDTHLWAEKYSGSLDDIFNIQENVSLSIANALKLKLTHKESEKILEHPIKNIAAYECYLNARHEIFGWNLESIERARGLLQNGLDILGGTEIIYAGMALSYIYQYEGGINASEESLENAKEFIDKVYETNPKSHQYYYLLGRIERFRGNNIEALRKFQSAYKIESNDPEILLFVGFHLALYAGKTDSAEPYVKKLLEIDPLTQLNYLLPMMYYLMKGEIKQTIHFARKASQFGPIFDYFLARYLAWNNQLDEAITIINQFLNKKNIDSYGFIKDLCLFLKYVLIGDKENALNALSEESKSYCWNDPDYPWHTAGYYSLINENVEALKWLEHAITRGMINFPLLNKMDPFLENIRGEERFKKLMEQVKYEWETFEV